MLKTGKMVAVGVLAVLAFATAAQPALAQNIGEIADSLKSQTGSVSTLISVVAFVLGVGMAIAGFMKFRANAQNPNDPSNKISTAFVLLFVGAGLVECRRHMGIRRA